MKYSWKFDKFDSEVFGFKVAKIIDLDPLGIKNLIEELIKNKVEYATYRVQSSDFFLIHALEKSNFSLVDGLITFSINSSEIKIEKTAKEIREANKNDIGELKNLTSGLYSNTRAFNDPFISKDKANEFYKKWIENSVLLKAADLVLVWEEKGKIRGYITLQKKGQTPLIGVSSESRGKGIGKKLISAAIAYFKKLGIKTVEIETQMQNIPALRAYQSSGFKIVNSYLTFSWHNKDK